MIDIDTRAANFMLSNVDEFMHQYLLNKDKKGFIEVITDGNFQIQKIQFIDTKIIPSTYAPFTPFRKINKEEQFVLFIQIEWKEFFERTRTEFVVPAKYAVKNTFWKELKAEKEKDSLRQLIPSIESNLIRTKG